MYLFNNFYFNSRLYFHGNIRGSVGTSFNNHRTPADFDRGFKNAGDGRSNNSDGALFYWNLSY